MIIQRSLWYHVFQWRGRIFIQQCHLRCLARMFHSTHLNEAPYQSKSRLADSSWSGALLLGVSHKSSDSICLL